MVTPPFTPVPTEILTHAADRTLAALRDPNTARRVAEYYTVESNYAGSTFTSLKPNPSDAIDGTDLLATSTLRVAIPVYSVRQFLGDDDVREEVRSALKALPKVHLAETTDDDFVSMEDFYTKIKRRLSRHGTKAPNPWVTASKLAARKRPDLFPIRDQVVCGYLGILTLRDCRRDWVVFRHLLRHHAVVDLVTALPEQVLDAAVTGHVVLDSDPLRLLDVALWRHALDAR